MTEITRVPLQQVAKGALGKLWLGIAAAVLAAGGLVWATMPPSVQVEVVKEGTGNPPTVEQVVFIKYTGKLKDGTVFDKSPDQIFPIKGVLPDGVPNVVDGFVPGFTEGLLKMRKGGKYVLTIPADKAYGDNPPPESKIPPGADLVFDVELVEIMSRDEAERRIGMAQQLMKQMQAQQQGGQQGGPQGAPPPQ